MTRKSLKLEKSPSWRGGRSHNHGYPTIKNPDHHRSDANGYVREQILIAEKALGKPLKLPIEVHHIDLSRNNNKPNNFVICQDHAYHCLLHQRTKALKATDDANKRYCPMCKTWDLPGHNDMVVLNRSARAGGNGASRHRRCHTVRERVRRGLAGPTGRKP